jgi:AcrR family transcriptional regulator
MVNTVSSNKGAGRPGRPRSQTTRLAILDAAADLALAGGCVPTVDAVATRAGVSRTTIYKWWPSAAAVLAEGLLERFHESIEFDDSLPVRTAVTAQVEALVRLLRETPAGALLRQLQAASASDERLGEALLTRWLTPRRDRVAQHLARGIDQGAIRADVDVDLVVDVLFAPVYHRLVWGHAPLDDTLAADLCDLVWPTIAAPGTGTTSDIASRRAS